jgi:hypothetical protein
MGVTDAPAFKPSNATFDAPTALHHRFVQDSALHPEWGASGIYGLQTVITPDGKPHLIGTVAKRGYIYDFSDQKVIYDFTAATGGTSPSGSTLGGSFNLAGPISNGDTYDAACYWVSPYDRANDGGKGWYYFGGFITGPAIAGTTFSSLNKFSYLLRTRDLINWDVLLKHQSADATSWRAEVTGLVGVDSVLYIMRGDTGGSGDQGAGLYSYNGTPASANAGAFPITRINSVSAFKGVVANDVFIYSVRGASNCNQIGLMDGGLGNLTLTGVKRMDGGTINADTTYQGSFGKTGGAVIMGNPNGYYWLGGTFFGRNRYVPALITGTPGLKRGIGWRSATVEAAGGLVTTANNLDSFRYVNSYTADAGLDNPESYLLWIGPSGQVRVLDVGGHFSGIAAHGGRLYYGVTEHPAANQYTNYLVGRPELNSIPIEQLKTRVVPYVSQIQYNQTASVIGGTTGTYFAATSGVVGLLGGWPTSGYRHAKLRLTSDTAGTLTFYSWSSQMAQVQVGTATFTAGQTQIIDLAQYLDGNLLGIKFSVDAQLSGTASFA